MYISLSADGWRYGKRNVNSEWWKFLDRSVFVDGATVGAVLTPLLSTPTVTETVFADALDGNSLAELTRERASRERASRERGDFQRHATVEVTQSYELCGSSVYRNVDAVLKTSEDRYTLDHLTYEDALSRQLSFCSYCASDGRELDADMSAYELLSCLLRALFERSPTAAELGIEDDEDDEDEWFDRDLELAEYVAGLKVGDEVAFEDSDGMQHVGRVASVSETVTVLCEDFLNEIEFSRKEAIRAFLYKHPTIQDESYQKAYDRLVGRIEELLKLENGWLEGINGSEGEALSPHSVKWFVDCFKNINTWVLANTFIYPTPEGNLLLEWTISRHAASFEIDFKENKGFWYVINLDTKVDQSFELDLTKVNWLEELTQLILKLN